MADRDDRQREQEALQDIVDTWHENGCPLRGDCSYSDVKRLFKRLGVESKPLDDMIAALQRRSNEIISRENL